MPSFNRVLFMGHLTRDPELKSLPSGTQVAEFGLGANRKWKTPDGQDKEEVCFVECCAFGKPADILAKYMSRGKALFVEGRLKLEQWEDKQGGKRSKLRVVVENFQFVGAKAGEAQPGEQRRQKTDPPPDAEGLASQEFKESDIPF